MPKVSVIIPVYNAEKYLAECLGSVLAQTLRDIEIICIDDGSKDRSGEILDAYAAKDSRIVVVHQANAGPSAARNNGIDLANGDSLQFVDSDDTIDPTLCEKAVAAADQRQADMTFHFYENTHLVVSRNYFETLKQVVERNPVFHVDNQTLDENVVLTSVAPPWAKLWRTEFVKRNNIRFPVGVCHEDTVAHWKGLIAAPVVAVVPEVLYGYRHAPGSLMNDSNVGYGRGIGTTYECIKNALIDAQSYHGAWKRVYLWRKLTTMCSRCRALAPQFMETTKESIRNAVGPDEREYLENGGDLPRRTKDFYLALDGDKMAGIREFFWSFLSRMKSNIAYRFWERNRR